MGAGGGLTAGHGLVSMVSLGLCVHPLTLTLTRLFRLFTTVALGSSGARLFGRMNQGFREVSGMFGTGVQSVLFAPHPPGWCGGASLD